MEVPLWADSQLPQDLKNKKEVRNLSLLRSVLIPVASAASPTWMLIYWLSVIQSYRLAAKIARSIPSRNKAERFMRQRGTITGTAIANMLKKEPQETKSKKQQRKKSARGYEPEVEISAPWGRWAELTNDEHIAVEKLGWNQSKWVRTTCHGTPVLFIISIPHCMICLPYVTAHPCRRLARATSVHF
jgi:hypothetical protein